MSSERRRKGKDRAQEAPSGETVTAELDFGNRPLCAPLQQNLKDVPVLHFNLGAHDFLAEFDRVIGLTMARAQAIAPATLLGKPVTPIANPCNRPKPYDPKWDFKDGNSHYIIEMRFTQEEDGKYHRGYDGLRVRILFCDYNGYQIGFSRYLYGKWSVWYHCSNKEFPLPFFLKQGAIKLNFAGDYTEKPDIGGHETFLRIFILLGHYPEMRNIDDVNEAFLASAVVLCETRRILWVFMEVQERIRLDQAPGPLNCNVPGKERLEGIGWTEITDWGTDCTAVLTAVRTGEYKQPTKEKGYAERVRPLLTFSELVGHLRLLKCLEDTVAPVSSDAYMKLSRRGLKLGARVGDPGFPGDPIPPEGEEDE